MKRSFMANTVGVFSLLVLSSPFFALSEARADQDSLNASLRQAAMAGLVGELQKLLAEGAEVDAMAPHGETALQYAALRGHTRAVRELLLAGAKVNHRDYRDNTPLLVAASNCNPKTVRELLKWGAKVNLENHNSSTALTLATDQGCGKTVEILLAVPGIDVIHKDDWDRDALDYARENSIEPGFFAPEVMYRLRHKNDAQLGTKPPAPQLQAPTVMPASGGLP